MGIHEQFTLRPLTLVVLAQVILSACSSSPSPSPTQIAFGKTMSDVCMMKDYRSGAGDRITGNYQPEPGMPDRDFGQEIVDLKRRLLKLDPPRELSSPFERYISSISKVARMHSEARAQGYPEHLADEFFFRYNDTYEKIETYALQLSAPECVSVG